MAPDIKKLISGFLIAAALTASTALVLPSFFPSAPASSGAGVKEKEENASLISNAFVQNPNTMPSSLLAESPAKGQNLTRELGLIFSEEVIRANQTAGNFDQAPAALVVPKKADLEAAIQEKIAKAAETNLSVPDFEEAIPDRTLQTLSAAAPEELARYADAAQNILGETLGSKAFQGLLGQNPGLESAYAAAAVYGNTKQSLEQVPVPEPLRNLHKAMLAAIRNRKTLVDLALGDPSDPLKSLAIIERVAPQIDRILTRDYERFSEEAARLEALSLSAPKETRNLVLRVLGIHQALAQGYVGIETNGPIVKMFQKFVTKTQTFISKTTDGAWLQKLFEWVQNGLLQELKNQIIHMLELQIVNWINGGGKPQFVTDWKGFMANAFDNAAGATLQKILPKLCMPMSAQGLIRITLTTPSIPVYTGCTLSQIASNIKNFAESFRNGGWFQYSIAIQPRGNQFGALIVVHDQVLQEALASQKAAENKAVAGAGFLGAQICESDGKPPGPQFNVETREEWDGCPDGRQPIVRTPGKVVSDALAKALGSNFDLITGANGIGGLVATVADAALVKLISVGLDAATGRNTGAGLESAAVASNAQASAAQQRFGNILLNDEKVKQAQEKADQPPPAGATPESASARLEGTIASADTAGEEGEESLSSEPQNPEVNLQDAVATQGPYTQGHDSAGDHDAAAAIDGSTYTYSFATSPSGVATYWEVALPSAIRLDEVRYKTFADSRYTMGSYGIYIGNRWTLVGPTLVLFDETNERYEIDIFSGMIEEQVPLTAATAKDSAGRNVAPSALKVKKIRFEANQILFREVRAFKHLNPTLDLSKFPATLSAEAASDWNPRSSQWVTGTEYPAYNTPRAANQQMILVKVENAAGTELQPSMLNPLRYSLPAGTYRVSYWIEADGFTSATRVRTLTVK